MESAVPVRLTCEIPADANLQVASLAVRRRHGIGRTLAYLMEQAKKDVAHPIMTFGQDKGVRRTLNVPRTWLDEFEDYRAHHGLFQNTAFMKDAVLRGLSIENGRGGAAGAANGGAPAAAEPESTDKEVTDKQGTGAEAERPDVTTS